ncbi:hypothetical protein [Microcoleus sp. B3-D7]|uniref:hypothetical protein n=1 Tax=Microcoleus sp. B3-D7 TaxID=2818659 RepID=UPI002FD2C0C6
MSSSDTNILGLQRVADFPSNQHPTVVTAINRIPHQLEFYVYQGKFSLYVPPENLEAAKVLCEPIPKVSTL